MSKILFEKQSEIAFITFNRPEVNNAFNPEMILEAQGEFIDNDDLRVPVLTGAGDRSVCSGTDLKAAAARIGQGETAAQGLPASGMNPSAQTWKPIIAAINSYSVAG